MEKAIDFDYSRELPSQWEWRLQQIQNDGYEVLRSRVFWGSHESVRGVRDFAKMSRLRLEKFLSLAQDLGFRVDLICGFGFESECYPEWTFSLGNTSLVPSGLAETEAFNFSMRRFPSLKNSSIRDAFLEFFDELCSLCVLYIEPEGSLRRIEVDFTTEGFDADAFESEKFVSSWEDRYGTIENLNLTYGTAFRAFESCATRQGLRVLSDKRPWLAAFDFKRARQAWLSHLFGELSRRQAVEPLLDRLKLLIPQNNKWTPTGTKAFLSSLVCDEVPLEKLLNRAAPLAPGGHPLLSSIFSARLFSAAIERCEAIGLTVEKTESLVKVVLCSRFLSKNDHEKLSQHLEAGGHIYFPMQTPHYDETLSSHPYTTSRGAEEKNIGPFSFHRWDQRGGSVWTCAAPDVFGESLWNHVALSWKELEKQLCV